MKGLWSDSQACFPHETGDSSVDGPTNAYMVGKSSWSLRVVPLLQFNKMCICLSKDVSSTRA